MNTKNEQFMSDVIAGLSLGQKALPCKYLYDEDGSRLFEAICETSDYYVTRADLAVLDQHLPEMAKLIGEQVHVIEFGSGAGVKTRHLLRALNAPVAYTPIEISASALEASAEALRGHFPKLAIRPLQWDYTQDIPSSVLSVGEPDQRRLVFFPGSTISNFTHTEAAEFLSRIRNMIKAQGDRPDGGLLIGVDLIKAHDILVAAYDDSEGVTRDFNLNLLHRINRELDANFAVDQFRHEARYNTDHNRIEMHLVSQQEQQVRINGHRFEFKDGESIHTENSHKYSVEGFSKLAKESGLKVVKSWVDDQQLFSTHYLECDPGFVD
ncbi:MAG: L-histidine N(alpha)-methyltransferase [Xanthomonadales bacterium]|nr:L-histidine N(alpha)-methyltransferase [Xanthomonadales bacterium]